MKPNETLVWILYDISRNKARTKMAKLCQEAGLFRVQLSVFLGAIERNRLDELTMALEELMDKDVDSLYVFPMCKQDFKKVVALGEAFDRALVAGEIQALFV